MKEDAMGTACSTHGEKNAYRLLEEKRERRRPLGRPRLHGRIILKWFLGKQGGVEWTVLIWLKIGNSGGLL
jgi:hypothetical protein